MKKAFYTTLLCTLLISCVKESSDEFFAYPNSPLNDTAWIAPASLAAAPVQQIPSLLSFQPYTDSFDVATGATARFAGNLQIAFPAGSLNLLNGSPVTGKIQVQVLHLKSRGDMVRYAIPTTSYNRLLESAGAFFVKAVKDGQELAVVPGKSIAIKFAVANPLPLMKVFYGMQTPNAAPGQNTPFNWIPSADSVRTFEQRDSLSNVIRGYEMSVRQLGWVNCNSFIDSTQPRSPAHILLAANFTNANTSVYAVFKEQKVVVQLSPELASRSFLAQTLPLNKNIIFISLSKIGDDLYLGIKETAVTSGLALTLKPEKKTKQQVIQYLETLQ
jgi:hypothetical protein